MKLNILIFFIKIYFQIIIKIFDFYILTNKNNFLLWGLGIGDWGLGIGDWGLGPIPNPQSPIPNPQSPIKFYFFIKNFKFFSISSYKFNLINKD